MTRFRGGLAILLLSVACLVLYGCGDPGWSVAIRNDTDQSVLVRIYNGSAATIGYLPAGAEGDLSGSLGEYDRRLQVLDPDCTIASRVETGDKGRFTVIIAADGTVTATPRDQNGAYLDEIRQLGRVCGSDKPCPFATPPWPSEIPLPSDQDWGVHC